MHTIEHYGEEKKKMTQVAENEAMKKEERLSIVDAYLKGQEAGDMSREQIFKQYFEKYKDFLDLDNEIVRQMKPKEKRDLLKDLIYKHEILHEEAGNMGVKKAA